MALVERARIQPQMRPEAAADPIGHIPSTNNQHIDSLLIAVLHTGLNPDILEHELSSPVDLSELRRERGPAEHERVGKDYIEGYVRLGPDEETTQQFPYYNEQLVQKARAEGKEVPFSLAHPGRISEVTVPIEAGMSGTALSMETYALVNLKWARADIYHAYMVKQAARLGLPSPLNRLTSGIYLLEHDTEGVNPQFVTGEKSYNNGDWAPVDVLTNVDPHPENGLLYHPHDLQGFESRPEDQRRIPPSMLSTLAELLEPALREHFSYTDQDIDDFITTFDKMFAPEKHQGYDFAADDQLSPKVKELVKHYLDLSPSAALWMAPVRAAEERAALNKFQKNKDVRKVQRLQGTTSESKAQAGMRGANLRSEVLQAYLMANSVREYEKTVQSMAQRGIAAVDPHRLHFALIDDKMRDFMRKVRRIKGGPYAAKAQDAAAEYLDDLPDTASFKVSAQGDNKIINGYTGALKQEMVYKAGDTIPVFADDGPYPEQIRRSLYYPEKKQRFCGIVGKYILKAPDLAGITPPPTYLALDMLRTHGIVYKTIVESGVFVNDALSLPPLPHLAPTLWQKSESAKPLYGLIKINHKGFDLIDVLDEDEGVVLALSEDGRSVRPHETQVVRRNKKLEVRGAPLNPGEVPLASFVVHNGTVQAHDAESGKAMVTVMRSAGVDMSKVLEMIQESRYGR